ncbi:MAG: T9SS type A sorting domain-containing protein [Candidatus Electryonea clarkiae]|nr:T9SS type A sorting domain-containing protein [Candidatus Electryonea clarkiae]MDP8288649.1 T9SS type A sorting domain-containing protein [Candidatus Electryonea clarkiae]
MRLNRRVLILIAMYCIVNNVIYAESRSLNDRGVTWQGDWYIHSDDITQLFNYPYIYVYDQYSIRVHKINAGNHNRSIDYIHRLPLDRNRQNSRSYITNQNGLVVWGNTRYHIAEQVGDSLVISFEGSSSMKFYQPLFISPDSLLITSKILYSLRTPSSPESLWASPFFSIRQAVIVGDRLFATNVTDDQELRIFDISDTDDIQEIGNYDGPFACNVQAQTIGNSVAFPRFNEEEYGIHFVFLNEELEVTDIEFWSYNDHINTPHPFMPSYLGVMEVNQQELYAYFSHEQRGENQPSIFLFDPDRYPDDILVENVLLPVDWEFYIDWFVDGPPCAMSDNLFFFNTLDYGETDLISIGNDFQSNLNVEDHSFFSDAYSSYHFLPFSEYLCTSDDLNLVYDLADDTTGEVDKKLILTNLFTGGIPDTVGMYHDYLTDGDIRDCEIIDRKIILTHGDITDVFRINIDSTIVLAYSIDDEERIYNHKSFNLNNQLFSIMRSGHFLKLYQIQEDEAILMDTLASSGARDFHYNQNMIYAINSAKIISIELSNDYELSSVDTVYLPFRTTWSGIDNAVDDNWLGAGPFLYSIENNALNLEHTFDYDSPRVQSTIRHISGEKVVVYYRHPGRSRYLCVFDLSDGSFTDTLALIMDQVECCAFDGDTLWTLNESSQSRYVLTGEFEGVELSESSIIPNEYCLYPAYPNPFNPDVNISFDIPVLTNVKLTVYDLLGRTVTTLLNNRTQPGHHTVTWNGINDSGTPVSSGLYFIRLESDSFSQTRKIVMLK